MAGRCSSRVRRAARASIELFTSQGCSSCPAADKLAGELAQDPSLVVMSLPIDYWDYLGWKDTLAIAGHTNRQRAYSKVRGDREVYTPQVVVNGVDACARQRQGRRSRMRSTQTRKQAGTLSVPVELSVAGDQISVSVPAAANSAKGEIWLCPITRTVPVEIGKGENSGKTITYTQRGSALGEARRVDRRGAHLQGAGERCRRAPAVMRWRSSCRRAARKRRRTMLGAAIAALRSGSLSDPKRQSESGQKNRAGVKPALRSVGGLNRTRN